MREDNRLSWMGTWWQGTGGEQYIVPGQCGQEEKTLIWLSGIIGSSPGHPTNSLDNVGDFSWPLWLQTPALLLFNIPSSFYCLCIKKERKWEQFLTWGLLLCLHTPHLKWSGDLCSDMSFPKQIPCGHVKLQPEVSASGQRTVCLQVPAGSIVTHPPGQVPANTFAFISPQKINIYIQVFKTSIFLLFSPRRPFHWPLPA